jgi:hypothetical protein
MCNKITAFILILSINVVYWKTHIRSNGEVSLHTEGFAVQGTGHVYR